MTLFAATPAAAQEKPLTLAGGDAVTRKVPLLRDANAALTGKTTFLLTNGSQTPVSVVVRYFPDAGEALNVTASTVPVAVTGRTVIPAETIGVLTLQVRLDRESQPSDLDGTVEIRALADKQRSNTVGSVQARLTGAMGTPTGVTFEPQSVALKVTRGVGLTQTSGDTTKVRLRGPGVARLLAQYGRLPEPVEGQSPPPAATLLLANDAGRQAVVELRDFRRIGPDLAEVKLRTQDVPAVGAYEGTIPLVPGTLDGPTLNVKVRSQLWFPIALALVLLGSLLGGLLPQVTALSGRKKALRTRLCDIAARYQEVRGTEATAAWNLDERFGPKPWFPEKPAQTVNTPGIASLWSNIHFSNSAKDLEDDTAAVLALEERLGWWLKVEPPARELRSLQQLDLPDRGGRSWQDTQVVRDTSVLLECAHDEPENEAANTGLRLRLEKQLRLQRAFAEAWRSRYDLELHYSMAQVQEHQRLWNTADVDALDQRFSATPEAERSRTQGDALSADLKRALSALGELAAVPTGNGGVQVPAGPPALPGPVAVKQLPAPAAAPVAVRSDAPPAATADRPHPRLRVHPWRWMKGSGTDLLMTAMIPIVTVVAYMLPLYTGTWGTWQDWLTAFAAGFLGQVAIKWALMPIFQSRRLRVDLSGMLNR